MAFPCQHNQKSLPKKKKGFFSYRCSAIFYILLYSELMYTDVNLRAAALRNVYATATAVGDVACHRRGRRVGGDRAGVLPDAAEDGTQKEQKSQQK